MRLAELSERSGVSTATIKYYLREGLLPPGRRVNATTAEYDEEHLRRLRLVRALIQVGRVPVATAREVLGARRRRLAGPHDAPRRRPLGPAARPGAGRGGPGGGQAAQRRSTALLDGLGWRNGRGTGRPLPAYRLLVEAVATCAGSAIRWDAELGALRPAVPELAVHDLDLVETYARRRRSRWSGGGRARARTSRCCWACTGSPRRRSRARRYGVE